MSRIILPEIEVEYTPAGDGYEAGYYISLDETVTSALLARSAYNTPYTFVINGEKHDIEWHFAWHDSSYCALFGNPYAGLGLDASSLVEEDVEEIAEMFGVPIEQLYLPYGGIFIYGDEEIYYIGCLESAVSNPGETVTFSIEQSDGWHLDTTTFDISQMLADYEAGELALYENIVNLNVAGIQISNDPTYLDTLYRIGLSELYEDDDGNLCGIPYIVVEGLGSVYGCSFIDDENLIKIVAIFHENKCISIPFLILHDDIVIEGDDGEEDQVYPKGCYWIIADGLVATSWSRWVSGSYKWSKKTTELKFKDFHDYVVYSSMEEEEEEISAAYEQALANGETDEDFAEVWLYDYIAQKFGMNFYIILEDEPVFTQKISDEYVSGNDIISGTALIEDDEYTADAIILGSWFTVYADHLTFNICENLTDYLILYVSEDTQVNDYQTIPKGSYLCTSLSTLDDTNEFLTSVSHYEAVSTVSNDWFYKLFINEAKPALQPSKRLYELEVLKEANEETISSQKSEISDLNSTISSQKSEISDLNSTISSQKSEISDLNSTIAELESNPAIIELSTVEEMNAVLIADNIGNIYRYTGESDDNYTNGELYEVIEA